MARLVWALCVVVLLGCASNAPDLPEPAEQAAAGQLLSTVHMADSLGEPQLVEGFHGVEQGAWRWTGKTFAVKLGPPPIPDGEAANLEFKFTIPGVSIEQLGALTLVAMVDGEVVGEETYEEAGEFLFSTPVGAELLAGKDEVQVEFSLDKAFVPGGGDDRELGVVALSVGLR